MWVSDDAAFDAVEREGRDERAEGDWNYHSHSIGNIEIAPKSNITKY